jgi:hypothetical protein
MFEISLDMEVGPLFDIGCYAILSGCMIFKGEPKVLSAVATMCDQYETEKQVDATLRWPMGKHSALPFRLMRPFVNHSLFWALMDGQN